MRFHPLDVLAHVERRRILSELSRQSGPIDVTVGKTQLVDGTVDAEIVNDILFFHLPKMAEHGYVSFDDVEGTVSRGPRFDVIRPYLRSTNGHRDETESV